MNGKLVKVNHSFLNKKGEVKCVNYWMDEKLYKSILTLSKEDQNYWLSFYYNEYNKEKYQKKKEHEKIDIFICVDCDNNENDGKGLISTSKLLQISDDYEKDIINKCFVEKMLDSLDKEDSFILKSIFMQGYSKTEVAKKLEMSITAINKRINKTLNKLKEEYIKN